MRLTPTDVSQFVRLEQCERFLRFRLAERAGQNFMEDYDVNPQRITPLLSLSGHDFEEGIETDLAKRLPHRQLRRQVRQAHNRPDNNSEVVEEARKLAPGKTVLLFQPRLEVELAGWLLRGDVDLVRLERHGGRHAARPHRRHEIHRRGQGRTPPPGRLLPPHAGATAQGRRHQPQHRSRRASSSARPPTRPRKRKKRSSRSEKPPSKSSAWTMRCSKSSPTRTPTSSRPTTSCWARTRRPAEWPGTPFETIPYCLSFKCDGCLYNEFCMKWSAEKEDLSLLPYMTGTEKEALRRAGITTVQSLATLKDFAPEQQRPNSSRPRVGKPRSSRSPPPGRSAPGSMN